MNSCCWFVVLLVCYSVAVARSQPTGQENVVASSDTSGVLRHVINDEEQYVDSGSISEVADDRDGDKKHFKIVRTENGTLSVVILDGSRHHPLSTVKAPADVDAPTGQTADTGVDVIDCEREAPSSAGKPSDDPLVIGSRRQQRDSPKFSFPNENVQQYVPTQCADDKIICDEDANYPKDLIEMAVGRVATRFGGLFGADNLPDATVIGERFGLGSEQLCFSKKDVIYPTKGLNKENDWIFIVNSGNYKQGVSVDICENTNTTCRFADNFPNSKRTSCEQMYIYRIMVAVNKDGNPEKHQIKMPSCCQCVLYDA